MAGYLIAFAAFLIPFALSVTRLGRPGRVLVAGGLLALAWVAAMAAGGRNRVEGKGVVPLWFLAGLVGLLFAIWCGGVLLGMRIRRMRAR